MSNHRYIQQLTGAALALLIGGGASSAPPSPAGLIAFSPVTLADSGGAPLGQATLSYQDQTYEVVLNGLGVGGAQGIKTTVTGEVYGLNDLAALEGPYTTELATAPPTEVSSADLWLYSDGGVSIHLHTDDPAATIASGSDTVMVQFGQGQ
jgi:hypothetical protein